MNALDISNNKSFQIHLKKPKIDAYWLAGFFEGDGCLSIAVPKPGTYVLSFILRQADPKVLYKVKTFLGSGSVYCDSKGYWTLTVKDKAGLFKVACLLNGKLVLQKRIVQFGNWITAFNTKYGTSLVAVNTPASLSWQNAWLTGFADAEGSFNIMLYHRKDNIRLRLRLRFYLDQSYSLCSMQALQSWLGGNLHAKTKNMQQYDRLILDTLNQCDKLVKYFSQYPPLTTCLMVRFIRYARVYHWYVHKQWQDRVKQITHLILLNKRLQKKQKYIMLS